MAAVRGSRSTYNKAVAPSEVSGGDYKEHLGKVQFTSVAQLCLTLCDPMDCSTPGLPVYHQLLEFTQTCVHWVGDAIHPSCPPSCPSPTAFYLSQHQGVFQWVGSSYQVAKVIGASEFQHSSFQWICRVDFLRINWFDLAVHGTLKSLFQHHIIFWCLAFFMVHLFTPVHD